MSRNQLIAYGLVILLLSSSVDAGRRCTPSLQTELLIKAGVFATTFGATYLAAPIVLAILCPVFTQRTLYIMASSVEGAIGFGPLGVIGGSLAAWVQSTIGNVAANSLFAKLTSLGATGVNLKSAASIAAWAAKADISEELQLMLGLTCTLVE